MIKEGDKIAVWFSCGAASAIALSETIRLYGDRCEILALNNYIKEEDEDNQRFLRDVEKWLDIKIHRVINPKYPNCSIVEVFDERKFMSSPYGAPCTGELKKKARQIWEKGNHVDWHVLGFTSEEKRRLENFKITERSNVIGVLVDQGISKSDCFIKILDAGLALPRNYLRGYPNGNCPGCVKVTSATYWNHVRRVDPHIFHDRAVQSRAIGAKLVRCHPKYLSWCVRDDMGYWWDTRENKKLHVVGKDGKERLDPPRIYLDELPPNATGRKMKNLDFECGIFCEEKL